MEGMGSGEIAHRGSREKWLIGGVDVISAPGTIRRRVLQRYLR